MTTDPGEAEPPPPPYEDVPAFEMDDFRKDAGRFSPTPEMRDEDWSALGPRKGG